MVNKTIQGCQFLSGKGSATRSHQPSDPTLHLGPDSTAPQDELIRSAIDPALISLEKVINTLRVLEHNHHGTELLSLSLDDPLGRICDHPGQLFLPTETSTLHNAGGAA